MKKLVVAVVIAVVVMMAAGMAGTAMAAGNQTVAVSATVVGVCQFLTGGAITFNLDPSVGGAVNGVVTQPTFWCTRGTTWAITDDSGLHELVAGSPRMLHTVTGGEFIPYSFSYTAGGTGSGRGTTISMDIASSVAAVNYLNALAGNYDDTVTLSINP